MLYFTKDRDLLVVFRYYQQVAIFQDDIIQAVFHYRRQINNQASNSFTGIQCFKNFCCVVGAGHLTFVGLLQVGSRYIGAQSFAQVLQLLGFLFTQALPGEYRRFNMGQFGEATGTLDYLGELLAPLEGVASEKRTSPIRLMLRVSRNSGMVLTETTS